MEAQEFSVEVRSTSGKGAARKIRAKGQVPGVVYGGSAAPVAVTFEPSLLKSTLKTRAGRNSVIKLVGAGESATLAMIKDIQVHPVSRDILHADFIRVPEDAPVTVEVPFHTEGRAEGVVAGGTLRQHYRTLTVRCIPGLIPLEITADVTNLQIGSVFKVSELKLPEGVTVTLPANNPVASVNN